MELMNMWALHPSLLALLAPAQGTPLGIVAWPCHGSAVCPSWCPPPGAGHSCQASLEPLCPACSSLQSSLTRFFTVIPSSVSLAVLATCSSLAVSLKGEGSKSDPGGSLGDIPHLLLNISIPGMGVLRATVCDAGRIGIPMAGWYK